MAKVTRSQFAGALRDAYGLDVNRDRKLVKYLWEAFECDAEDGASLKELVSNADTAVRAYFLRSEPHQQTTDTEDSTREVDLTRELGGGDSFTGESTGGASKEREWIGHRVSAFSEYLSKILAVDEQVIRFRKRALGSPTATLAPKQAEMLIHSPAAAYLPFAFFEERGVSITDHEATTESYETLQENGGGVHRATLCVESAGIRETASSRNPSEEGAIEMLLWPGLDGGKYATYIRVWRDSVLGELQRIGKRLSDEHPWEQDQAVNFVLTGTPQIASTLRAKTRRSVNRGVKAHKYNEQSVTLEVAHWVPADEVARAYRELQREVHDGGKNRKPSDRNIALFRHVVDLSYVKVKSVDESLAKLHIPKWRGMLKQWNKKYPPGSEWHYEDEYHKGAQRFQRDFKRGQLIVIGHYVGLPGDPSQPMTRAEQRAGFDNFKRQFAGVASVRDRKQEAGAG